MKARREIRVGKVNGIVSADHNAGTINVTIRHGAKSRRPSEYPSGSIGSSLSQRNYIKYLVERYHRFRDADSSFGRFTGAFSYAVIFKNIERHFKAPTYFIPNSRFEELALFLQRKVNSTILGKRNRARGITNYLSFEEFLVEQTGQESAKRA